MRAALLCPYVCLWCGGKGGRMVLWFGFDVGLGLGFCVFCCVGPFGGVGMVGCYDEPESLILAQSERWRHA